MLTSIQPGAVIDGKYRVIRRIGEGGMGTVYEGENIRIERRVAIKVLHEHVASSPEFAERFEREARASGRIGSPHVCDVLDLGDLPNGKRFIVMEFLEGESLEDRLEKGRLTAAQLAPIAFEILEGLGTMHQAGVVHRDLKPANIFLARASRKAEVVKILDFGVAKILASADAPSKMTSTGMMMGTPLYMSPEQARGARDVDGRTDLYSASVIFYSALTGQLPHSGANLHELLFRIVLDDPPPLRELAPDVDEAFAAIVMKGLARDPDQRYASARAYQEAIAAWGRAQGASSLQFTVTLPTDPPPPLPSSGSVPALHARPETPVTGPQARSGELPSAPAIARSQLETPRSRPSGGTPVVWAEDAPEIARRALAELEAKRQGKVLAPASSAGQTQVLPTTLTASTSSGVVDVTSGAPPAKGRSQGKGRVAMVAGAVAVVAIAAVGIRFGAPHTGASKTPASSSSAMAVASEPPPEAVPSPPSFEPPPMEPEAPAEVPAEPPPASSSASVTPPARGAAPSTSRRHVAPIASASASATAAAPASTSASTTPSAPTTKARKFRTNLD